MQLFLNLICSYNQINPQLKCKGMKHNLHYKSYYWNQSIYLDKNFQCKQEKELINLPGSMCKVQQKTSMYKFSYLKKQWLMIIKSLNLENILAKSI